MRALRQMSNHDTRSRCKC